VHKERAVVIWRALSWWEWNIVQS